MARANDSQAVDAAAVTIAVTDENARPTRNIAVVMFEGCEAAGAGAFAEVFAIACQLTEKSSMRYRWQLHFLSPLGGFVATRASFRVFTQAVDATMSCGYHFVLVAAGKEQGHALRRSGLEAWIQRLKRNATPVFMLGQPADCENNGIHPMTVDAAVGVALRLLARDECHGLALRVASHFENTLQCAKFGSGDLEHERPDVKARIAAQWLRRNSPERLTIDAAAASVQLSRRTLLRHFRDEFGMTPAEYLLHTRLKRACLLLIDSGLPVDKIARRVGMASGDRLAKVFRRKMGVSPTCYRMLNGI